jgi:hypothetical protein
MEEELILFLNTLIRNNNNNNNKYRNAENVEHEMLCHTSNHWGHRNCEQKFTKNLQTIPGQHSIYSLQKTAILGTSHIIRKVLQAETWKPEWWGSPLAQEEKYQGREKTCDRDDDGDNM